MTQARIRSDVVGSTALAGDGPIRPGQRTFTAAQLTRVLQRCGALAWNRSVVTVEARPLGVGESMMSELTRIHLTYDSPVVAGAPETIVVKQPCPDEYRRAIADRFGFYRREVEFYDHVAGMVAMRSPRCYASITDDDSSEFTLLLEDLSTHRTIAQVEGCGLADARLVVQALADFHASWWGRTDELSVPIVSMASPERIDDVVETFARSWPTCRALARGRIPDEVAAVGDRWASVGPDLVRRLASPGTVCHGDFRLDNLRFDGDQIVAFDWQLLTVANGVSDLAYFVSQSVRTSARRLADRSILEQYLHRLAGRGVDDDEADAWEVYRTAVLAMLIFPVTLYGGFDDLAPLGQRTAAAMLDRAIATIVELEAWDVPAAR